MADDILQPKQDEIDPHERVVTKVSPTGDIILKTNDYQIQPFTKEQEEQAYKESENSIAFRTLMKERQDKLDDYKKRHAKSAESAKALAWGNLFSNLAKLGGWGSAPVVQEDTKPLMSAFQEADNIRDIYYKTKDAYDSKLNNTRLNYVESARATHNAKEKAKYDAAQKAVDLYNEDLVKNRPKETVKEVYKNDPTEKLKQDKLQAEIASINARKDLTDQQKAKLIAEIQGGGSAKPFYAYAGKDGYTYNLNKSQAQDILNILRSDRLNKSQDLPNDYLTAIGNDKVLTGLIRGDKTLNDNAIQSVIAQYLNSYPDRFKDILSRTQRSKTKNYEEDPKPTTEQPQNPAKPQWQFE